MKLGFRYNGQINKIRNDYTKFNKLKSNKKTYILWNTP